MLGKIEKKKWSKIPNRKKMINQIQLVYNSGAKKNGELALDLKSLSKLIGGLFWCDSNAKIDLRSWTLCDLNFKFKFELSNSA